MITTQYQTSVIVRPDSVPEAGGDVGDHVPDHHQGHAHHRLEDDHKQDPETPYLPEQGALFVLILAVGGVVEAWVAAHLGLARGVDGHPAPVQVPGVQGGQGEVHEAPEVAGVADRGAVHQARDEVAGDRDDEGVGDDGDPGEGAHDVQPDADIPGILRNRSPISHKQFLGVQSRKTESAQETRYTLDHTRIYRISKMLFRRANRGARGKAATKMVMNPNWMTISRYSLKRSERSAGARPKSLTYPGAVSGSLAAPSWSSFSKFRPGKHLSSRDYLSDYDLSRAGGCSTP